MKRCAMCLLELPTAEFTADRRMTAGLKSYCKDCCRLDANARYAADPDHYRKVSRESSRRRYTKKAGRARHLWDMYRLTADRYEALLATQNYGCAICASPIPGGKGDWHVDHCHETGKVRGLLCAGCNVGIGHLRDDPSRLRAAANYIEMHSQKGARA